MRLGHGATVFAAAGQRRHHRQSWTGLEPFMNQGEIIVMIEIPLDVLADELGEMIDKLA